MKFGRNLYVVMTGIAAGSLLAGGLAEWSGHVKIAPVCYVVGAVGVIWLGRYWLKVAGEITSIARLLRAGGPTHTKADNNTLINKLSEAVGEQLESYSSHIGELEKQIRDLQIQFQLSQRQKRNTEAIIYSLRDAVIVVDELDRLLMANEAAGRLFNFDFRNSQYKPIGELIDKSKSEFVDFLRQSRQSKVRHTKREIGFSAEAGLRKDGKRKTSEGGKSRIFDCIVSCVYERSAGEANLQGPAKQDGEQICGVVAVLHDITREKEISQMKNDFVSAVCHELKTPLASITAYSEMLIDGEAKDSQMRGEFYSVIQSQAKRLNRLIENILNISRIESGLTKVHKEPVSLAILIEEQLQMIRSQAQEKNIEIVGQKPIVFDQVYADKDMISQVIVNLLSNAVKYTHSGGSVKIETEIDESTGTARVSVTDTGVGIPESELEHVFDKFYRVKANNKCAKGTGLGLDLVKQVIEKVHNGRVFVSSKPGVGSTFGFELPLAVAEAVEN